MAAELVMLDLAPGPAFVDAIRRVWDRGDAFFPLDRRLPSAEAKRVIAVVQPTAVIGDNGDRRRLDHGSPLVDGDAVVVATSGTTGEPKAVIHTHTSVAASSTATSAALDVDPARDHWVSCLPPAHIGGLAVIMRALHTGTSLTVHEHFDADRVDQAARDGATLVSLVTRALRQVDLDGYRAVLIGGAAPPPDLPAHVIPTYGMTETGSGCVYGRKAIDGVELRTNESGELEIRADLLLRAYRTLEGEVDPRTDDGWFPTGDLGDVADDGTVTVHGRAGDMIISGGENIHPARVEQVLRTHPLVNDVAVVGRPDPEWGHIVVAHIETASVGLTLDEVRDHVRHELPVWSAPKAIEVVGRLPRTAIGKIRRSDLG